MKSIGDGQGFVIRPITNGTRIGAFMISQFGNRKDHIYGDLGTSFPTYRLSLFHFTDRYALTCKFPFFYSPTVQRQCLIN